MIRDPYIGMPIIIDTDSEKPCDPGCGNNSCGNGNSGIITPDDTTLGAFDNMYLGNLPLAMCYVPTQRWNTTYPPDKGLARGTIFPELDLPFKGGRFR